MAQPSVHGRFIWQELMTVDTAAAGAFYPKVIGWRTQPFPQAGSSYSTFAADGRQVGGLTRLAEDAREAGARPHWLPFVGTDDVDATAVAVERLGGKVLRSPTNIDNVGRYAVLADPQGASFGAYKPQQSGSPARGQARPGEFAWQELATSDYEAAFRFYGELFGWQVLQRHDMGPAGTYLIFGRDGVQHGGIYKLSAQTPAPYWLSYIETADVEAAAAAARDAGGRVAIGPMDVPGGARIAQLLDPSGVLFAVHAAKGAAPAKAPAKQPAAKPAAVQPPPSAHAAPSAPARVAANTSVASKAPAKKAAAKKAPAKKAAKKAAKKKVPRRAAGKAARKSARKSTARRGAAKRAAGKTARRATAAGRRTAGRGAGARARSKASSRARAKAPVRAGKRSAARKTRRAAHRSRRR
ncbi:MAG TPA: VOC family protein [Steroidobacteraceae bacterium]|nr:VOC family protein [Steroidobacteraceae bacterium]